MNAARNSTVTVSVTPEITEPAAPNATVGSSDACSLALSTMLYCWSSRWISGFLATRSAACGASATMLSIWVTNGPTSMASTASSPTTNTMNTTTTAAVRRIHRSANATSGFSTIARNRAIPNQTITVRTVSSSDTTIENARTSASTLATVRACTSSMMRCGCVSIATRRLEIGDGDRDGGRRAGLVAGRVAHVVPSVEAREPMRIRRPGQPAA